MLFGDAPELCSRAPELLFCPFARAGGGGRLCRFRRRALVEDF